MKNIVIEESKTSINISQIEEFERYIDAKLPQDYKQFLLEHNGGHPIKNSYDMIGCLQYNNENESSAELAWFLAIHDGEYSNIKTDYVCFEDRIPKELISIACGSGGDQICLGVREGEHYGKVYFWDHENKVEEGDEPWWDNVILITNSFTDFINSLYKFDVKELLVNKNDYKYISKHDRYSLPYSNELKGKNRNMVKEFFDQASNEVEEFVIEEIESTKEKTLIYEEKAHGKRYKRTIKTDGTFIDSLENV